MLAMHLPWENCSCSLWAPYPVPQSLREEKGWEGAGVKSCGEERVIYARGDLEIALLQEVWLTANVID